MFFFFFFLFRFLLESLGGISVYVYPPFLFFFFLLFFFFSFPPSPSNKAKGAERQDEAKSKKGQHSQVRYIPSLYRPLRHKKTKQVRYIYNINNIKAEDETSRRQRRDVVNYM